MNLTLDIFLSRVLFFRKKKLAFGKYSGRIRVKTEREYGLGMRNRRQVIAAWETKPRKKLKK